MTRFAHSFFNAPTVCQRDSLGSGGARCHSYDLIDWSGVYDKMSIPYLWAIEDDDSGSFHFWDWRKPLFRPRWPARLNDWSDWTSRRIKNEMFSFCLFYFCYSDRHIKTQIKTRVSLFFLSFLIDVAIMMTINSEMMLKPPPIKKSSRLLLQDGRRKENRNRRHSVREREMGPDELDNKWAFDWMDWTPHRRIYKPERKSSAKRRR